MCYEKAYPYASLGDENKRSFGIKAYLKEHISLPFTTQINEAATYFLLLLGIPFCLCAQQKQDSFWKPYIDRDVRELNLTALPNGQYQTAFRIWNSYQAIELIQINDSTHQGQLINFVTKYDRKGNKKGLISQRLIIPETVTKLLVSQLSKEGIEFLPDCSDVEGYAMGFDGTSYQFEILSKESYRIYSYWEPENDRYQDPAMEEVRKVRNILTAVKAQFNPYRLFSDFRDRLPPGRYGYGMVLMTIVSN